MRIAILTSGILPVPAVRGGAVENLIDFYLEYNEQHRLHDITIYSVADPGTRNHPALQSEVNHYYYLEMQSLWAKIKKAFFKQTHTGGYYHHSIEYYFHEAFRHIEQLDYDMIVLENRPAYALRLAGKTNAKLVYHLHNDILNQQTLQHQELYNAANSIITISDYITRRVRTIQAEDTKCQTVLNGINIADFSCSEPLQVKRTDLGLKESDFVLSFSGRLIKEKGIKPLVEAMGLLESYRDIKLMILGSADLGDSQVTTPFLQEVYEKAKDRNNILFTGYINYQDMGHYLHLANVAVLPSLWEEPFGLTCAEALAARLPVITTRQGGIPEVVNEECAILLDATEELPHHLAEAILDLYHHPERRQAMSNAARCRSQLFSKQLYAQEFFKALEQVK